MQLLEKPMLVNFIPRLYQENIFATAAMKNTLVVLPTGLGKTGIALMLAAHRLVLFPSSKIVFLAPTKPLVEQHRATFERHLQRDPADFVIFTGEVSPEERKQRWTTGRLFFSTPQGLENDVLGSKISLKDVSLLILDEAHHATGDYAYVFLTKQYMKTAQFARILALTASPGSETEKIQEVCKNLFVEAVEIRSEDDPDVRPYTQEKHVRMISVPLPESFVTIQKALTTCIKSKLSALKSYGVISSVDLLSKKDLLQLQGKLITDMTSGSRDPETLRSVSLVAEVMKASHALELLETQGLRPLQSYCDRLLVEARTGKIKATKNLCEDPYFRTANLLVQELVDKNIDHPKLPKLKELIEHQFEQNQLGKCIVFTQYRDSAVTIKNYLASVRVLPEVFVGQAKRGDTGLSQKKQREVLDHFRDGLFNTLVSTSVAEEGLDIPSVDTVFFYEPIPSAIRAIQRMGRTARHQEGDVFVLIAKGTRDEAYRWSAHHKEKKMYRFLGDLKKNLVLTKPETENLQSYLPSEKVTLFADYREKGNPVLKELVNGNVELHLETLQNADYVLSPRVGVELKTVPDFVDSILDGRLLLQIKDLKKNFERPLLIIEGTEDVYGVRNVHPNAIRGMLATITTSYGIPVLQTRHAKDTAAFLVTIARREQEETGKDFTYHFEKRHLTETELQEYVISALPSVGASVAKSLLRRFGTVQNVMHATKEDLLEVDGVGDKIASRIREILERRYPE